MKKIFFLLLASALAFSAAYADTIILKTGQQVEARIVDRNPSSVKVDLDGTELTYYLDEVQSINGEPVSVSIQPIEPAQYEPVYSPPVAEEPPPAPFVDNYNTAPAAVEEPAPVPIVEDPKPIAPAIKEPMPARVTSRNSDFPKLSAKETKAALAVAGIIFLVFFVVLIVFYVYSAICLTFIAKKTGKEPAWLAWVPIGNVFLMCKIAGLSYWWILIILASVIPIVGSLSIAAFFIFLWYRIALARNKPGWLALLLIIPIANLVVMGYIAFSE
jgi:hypothetical protein